MLNTIGTTFFKGLNLRNFVITSLAWIIPSCIFAILIDTVISIENRPYLKAAIELGKKTYPDIKIIQGSIYELPYKDKAFDLVLCTEVLEHLENPDKALKELVRVSNKFLVISVPNEPFFMLAQLIRGKNWSRLGNDIEHINHWTMFGFPKFVKKNAGSKIKILAKRFPFAWTMLFLEK